MRCYTLLQRYKMFLDPTLPHGLYFLAYLNKYMVMRGLEDPDEDFIYYAAAKFDLDEDEVRKLLEELGFA